MAPAELSEPIALLQRAPVLAACRDGPIGRSTIAERASCSRSTAYRATGELESQGLLSRTDRGYRLTGAGNAVLKHVRQFRGQLAGTELLRPLLEYVDASGVVRRAERFVDAEVVEPGAERPYHVETRMRAIIEATEERMVGMTNGLGSPALAEAMLGRVAAGVAVEWILPPRMYEQFSGEYGTLEEQALREGQTGEYVSEDIPIDLAIYDETLVLIGFDADRGVLAVVAITEDTEAVAWARERFEACQGASERVE